MFLPHVLVFCSDEGHRCLRFCGFAQEDKEQRQSSNAGSVRPLEQTVRRHDSCMTPTHEEEVKGFLLKKTIGGNLHNFVYSTPLRLELKLNSSRALPNIFYQTRNIFLILPLDWCVIDKALDIRGVLDAFVPLLFCAWFVCDSCIQINRILRWRCDVLKSII